MRNALSTWSSPTAADGVLALPAAVALVTSGAAEAAGLADRGRLEPGLRADLALVEPGAPWPVVWAVLRAELRAE